MEFVSVKYLLDTHAAIWAAEEDPKLGQRAKLSLLASATGDALISEITLLEISMLVKKGKIQIQISTSEYLRRLQLLYPPVRITPTIATLSMDLPLPQGDPFDRIIVATARELQLTMVTKDQHIMESKLVPTLW
jgi:PIN domain nuclease of toxin-antitoxin system